MNKNLFLFLTQFTVIIHFLFIFFVIFGGFLAHKRQWIKIIHLISITWAIYAELSSGIVCPLTTLENYFAYQAGLSTYQEDFVTRYLIPIIYQESLDSSAQFVVVGVVICVNIVAYRIGWQHKQKTLKESRINNLDAGA